MAQPVVSCLPRRKPVLLQPVLVLGKFLPGLFLVGRSVESVLV